jgi:benzoylformate decarboxylase
LYSAEATNLPRPYVKWSCEPARAEDVPAAIARAYFTALQPPRGPTFVSIPADDWERPCTPPPSREVSRVIAGDPALLARAAAMLGASRRPVLVAGASVARDQAWDDLIALAERQNAPVWVSPLSSRNSFPERHPLFAGFLPADRERIVAQLAGHDLIVVLGAPVFTYHVEGHGPHIPESAALVQLTDDPAAAARAPQGLAIVTDLAHGIRALLASAQPPARPRPPVPPRAAAVPADHLTASYLMQQIAALRPAGSLVVEEAPSSRGAMHAHLPMLERDSFYTCASGGLGHGLPAAVGVALARPDRRVIALLGDGSAMYSIQGLWSAAQLAVPVTFVIVNNGGYLALEEFAPHFGVSSPPGTRLPHLDFCSLARAQGVEGVRVDRPADLDAALRTAFAATHPVLVEVCMEGAHA